MERYYAVICIMQFHGVSGRCIGERDGSAAAPGLLLMWGRLGSTSMRGTEQELMEMVLSSSILDRGCSLTSGTNYFEDISIDVANHVHSRSCSSFLVGSISTWRWQQDFMMAGRG